MARGLRHRQHPHHPQALVRGRQGVLPSRAARPDQVGARDTDGGAGTVLEAHQGAQGTRVRRSHPRGRRARLVRHVLRLRQRGPAGLTERPHPANNRHVAHGPRRHHVRGVHVPQDDGVERLDRVPGARASRRHRQPAERLRRALVRVLAVGVAVDAGEGEGVQNHGGGAEGSGGGHGRQRHPARVRRSVHLRREQKQRGGIPGA
mmetsp:Transcript_5275/g.19829  ORF Transcript_5275/g.19829 Transcript_5275/m.19829 type:complete len:205 (+) Transcript_5275:368-982(+)